MSSITFWVNRFAKELDSYTEHQKVHVDRIKSMNNIVVYYYYDESLKKCIDFCNFNIAERIRKAIEGEMPLLITTFTLPHEMELYIGEVVSFFLRELNLGYMIQYVLYCVSELTSNAKKANTNANITTITGANA